MNLPLGEQIKWAKVIVLSRDNDSNVVGSHDDNPVLNTMVYDVEFPYSAVCEYAANIIVENMFAQVNYDDFSSSILDGILDYAKTDDAVSIDNRYFTTQSGQRRLHKSTAGYPLLVLWRYGSEQWIPLSIPKESNPLEVADSAVSHKIGKYPDFHWWLSYTLRKRDTIVSTVNSRVKSVPQKYVIEVPCTVKKSLAFDDRNGNHLWRDALDKEMSNLRVDFDILDENQHALPGYYKASGHIIFDVRMTLERTTRWVKYGHRAPKPRHSTYAGVVSLRKR